MIGVLEALNGLEAVQEDIVTAFCFVHDVEDLERGWVGLNSSCLRGGYEGTCTPAVLR